MYRVLEYVLMVLRYSRGDETGFGEGVRGTCPGSGMTIGISRRAMKLLPCELKDMKLGKTNPGIAQPTLPNAAGSRPRAASSVDLAFEL